VRNVIYPGDDARTRERKKSLYATKTRISKFENEYLCRKRTQRKQKKITMKRYLFKEISFCEMCGDKTENHKVLGQH
jgi:hypothetical protein